jgi:C4-dicarboxylate-specific signal transduction histidine kinase
MVTFKRPKRWTQKLFFAFGALLVYLVALGATFQGSYRLGVILLLAYSGGLLYCIHLMSRKNQAQRKQINTSAKFAALGEMAAGIAHEINNPLASIKNLSGQLQEVLDDEPLDKPLVKEMAAKVERTTDRIAKIIASMRTFARNGSQDPIQPFHLGQMIEDTLAFCGQRLVESGTELRIASSAQGDIYAMGRSTEISQVVLNLLSNAHDAISDNKEKWIEISARELPDTVEIQITDSGHGVSPEMQAKIFEPFFTTKAAGKGTGMGLSISFGIVQAHGGQLKLDPHCPHTRFVIQLPKAKIARVKAAS